jgi:hypothetical protein
MAQDRDRWRTLVNTVMNLQITYNCGKLFSSSTTGSAPCSYDLVSAVFLVFCLDTYRGVGLKIN